MVGATGDGWASDRVGLCGQIVFSCRIQFTVRYLLNVEGNLWGGVNEKVAYLLWIIRNKRTCTINNKYKHGAFFFFSSLSTFCFRTSYLHKGRMKWQPNPVFLPGESQGPRSLVGCCLWGCTESDTTEVT